MKKNQPIKKVSEAAVEKTVGRLVELSRISSLFLEAEKVEAALAEALGIIRRLLCHERVYIYLYEEDDRLLLPFDSSQNTACPPLELPQSLLRPPEDRRKGPKLQLNDLNKLIYLNGKNHSEPWSLFFQLNRNALKKLEIRLIVPLGTGRDFLGAILLGEKNRDLRLSRDQLELLEAAHMELSLGLARFKLLKSIKRSHYETKLKILELETLQDIGIAIASILDLDQLTKELLLRAVSVLNVNRAMVLVKRPGESILSRIDKEPEPMYVAETFGLERAETDKLCFFGGCDAVLENLRKRIPTILNDSKAIPQALDCGKLLVMPIQFKGELLGCIMVGDKEGRYGQFPDFDQGDLSLLGAMANQAGAAISNAKLYSNVLEMKQYNENILTSIASGVITTDNEGRVVSYNDSAAKIFSIPASQAIGLKIEELFSAVDQVTLAEKLAATLKEGSTYQETNLRARTPAGSEIVFNISLTQLYAEDEKKSTRGVVVSVENISEGARVKEMLKRYVSANIVDLALEKEHELALGGKLCEVTILFTDIRGFTEMSEEKTPGEVVDLLNSYFDLMIDVVFRYNGTVDKIVGDELMVLFGAPFAFKDDTHRAVGCALAMLEALGEFNKRRLPEGHAPLAIGIGLNRGSVISGNIGSTKHMDYTVIGDAVNLASRLVGHAAKGQILISRSVYENLNNSFLCRRMENIRVKGKKDPIEVFEVLHKNRQK
ncbi:MAG TPA: adenylate/guanylate cyclase domain-containing protein [archaeon]|nr:adenylate/guanylate cyclase domain-containing protein [archaeon]